MLIHQTQTFQAYHFLASKLVSLKSQLADGETALFDAF